LFSIQLKSISLGFHQCHTVTQLPKQNLHTGHKHVRTPSFWHFSSYVC